MSYSGYGDEFPLNVRTQGLQADLYTRFDESGLAPSPPDEMLTEDGLTMITEDSVTMILE